MINGNCIKEVYIRKLTFFFYFPINSFIFIIYANITSWKKNCNEGILRQVKSMSRGFWLHVSYRKYLEMLEIPFSKMSVRQMITMKSLLLDKFVLRTKNRVVFFFHLLFCLFSNTFFRFWCIGLRTLLISF